MVNLFYQIKQLIYSCKLAFITASKKRVKVDRNMLVLEDIASGPYYLQGLICCRYLIRTSSVVWENHSIWILVFQSQWILLFFTNHWSSSKKILLFFTSHWSSSKKINWSTFNLFYTNLFSQNQVLFWKSICYSLHCSIIISKKQLTVILWFNCILASQ